MSWFKEDLHIPRTKAEEICFGLDQDKLKTAEVDGKKFILIDLDGDQEEEQEAAQPRPVPTFTPATDLAEDEDDGSTSNQPDVSSG